MDYGISLLLEGVCLRLGELAVGVLNQDFQDL
jgi:hypothetical protein